LADGTWVTWSIAEGRRGRRWREVRSRADTVLTSLLLETDPEGRFAHLETSTSAGLITLHPEPDGTLHGNVVSTDGVTPIAGWPWSDDAIVLLEGSPICQVGAAIRLAASIGSPSTRAVPTVFISLPLEPESRSMQVERIDAQTWRFGASLPLTLDENSLPVLAASRVWALEEG
jgi:hypothetical protein